MNIDRYRRDPFRLCFPVGAALGMVACALWIVYVYGGVGSYPGQYHAQLFIGGFLYYFIMGFLMTAVPRFTQAHVATSAEIGILVVQILATLTAVVIGNELAVWLCQAVGWVFLIVYAVKRFLQRGSNPPPTFIFVGLGIASGLIGMLCFVVFHLIPGASVQWMAAGKTCLYDVMVLSMILGVGGRLIPGILGFNQIMPVPMSTSTARLSFLRTIPPTLYLLALAFIVSIIFDIASNHLIAYALRAIVITTIALQYWQIQRPSEHPTWFTRMVKLTCIMVVVGAWFIVFTASDPIAAKHVLYIGGYVFLTLLVAGRVTTSHSGLGTSIEDHKHPYLTIGLFLVLAAATRASANYFPNVYESHLGYAAICVLLVLIMWALRFVPAITSKPTSGH